jgi:hypothetical protein
VTTPAATINIRTIQLIMSASTAPAHSPKLPTD